MLILLKNNLKNNILHECVLFMLRVEKKRERKQTVH